MPSSSSSSQLLTHLIPCITDIPPSQILGMGSTGLVIRHNHHPNQAIKLPLRWDTSTEEDLTTKLESLHHEQSIYNRLGTHPGIVPVLAYSTTSITLQLMENGDLRSYLDQDQDKLPNSLSKHHLFLAWFRTMAYTLAYIHDRKVVVADIAMRNFLLDGELGVKFCDFSEAKAFPLETFMSTAAVDEGGGGYSVKTDIGQLGAVMYEVVVGVKCVFDIWGDDGDGVAVWPRREDLPGTEGVWLGEVIERCWTEGDAGFGSAWELGGVLDEISILS